MNRVEFITELSGSPMLCIPAEAASQLPKSGKVRVLILTEHETNHSRLADYEQFLLDDSAEDAIYGLLR